MEEELGAALVAKPVVVAGQGAAAPEFAGVEDVAVPADRRMLLSMAPPTAPGRRLSADDWIDAGFAVLADSGPNGLRVDALCDRLNVTKGSFYWHFTDMPAYRSALVEASWVMLRLNPWARALYDRLCGGQKTRKKKAIVAVARKLLVRCWVMLLRKEPWRAVTPLAEPAGACV